MCDQGHPCEKTFNNLYLEGKRCKECNKYKLKTIKYVYKCCEKINFQCLETEYNGIFEKMKCVCKKCGYIVYKTLASIQAGKGCVFCKKLLKPTIEEVKVYCLSVGFECLSDIYENAHIKLKLLCVNKHIFYACFDKIKQNRGCPHCKASRAEKMVKYILECLIDKKFEKIRPDELKYPETGRNLEIDMYNQELNLGFEYQGEQHFNKVSKFKTTDEILKKQKEHDLFKQNRCKEIGMNLIFIKPIPRSKSKYNPDFIKAYIINILIEHNIDFIDKEILPEDIIKAGNI